MKRLVYLIGLLILAMACKEVFEAPPQSFLVASFYEGTTNKSVKVETVIQGVGVKSILYSDSAATGVLLPLTIKNANLPLSVKDTTTTRYIVWLNSISDSLTFIHETTQKLASIESGFYYEYKLLSVRFTQNRIDSVKITDSLVTKNWHENIKLYIHP